MKKNFLGITVLLLTILFLAGNAYSQKTDKQKKTPEELATKKAGRMKEKLSLSEDQYKQVYNLVLTQEQNKIRHDGIETADKETRKQMKMQSRGEFRKQLEGILNKEQLEKMNQNRGKHKHQKGDKKKARKEK